MHAKLQDMFFPHVVWIKFALDFPTEVAGIPGVRVRSQAVTQNSTGEGKLYLHGRSSARHCLRAVRRRAVQRINRICLKAVLAKHRRINCMKIDIEGSELAMLAELKIPKRIKCMVVEYSFSVDPAVASFEKGVRRLKRLFANVQFPPSALNRPVDDSGTEICYSNRDIILHCWGRK